MPALRHSVWALGATLWLSAAGQAAPGDPASPAGQIFADRCANCHDPAGQRAASAQSLAQLTPAAIIQALGVGTMKSQAAGLTALDVSALAKFLTGQAPTFAVVAVPEKNPCPDPAQPVALGAAQWNGWGRDPDNSRYQPEPAIRAADVAKIAVKWAFGYHSSVAFGQPTVVDGRLFVTSSAGRVYALDAASGCTYWTYDATASSRTAVSVGEFAASKAVYRSKKERRKERNAHVDIAKPPSAVFFGDDAGFVYALDAQKGNLLWKVQADAQPGAHIAGAPALYRNRLYVPVASAPEAPPPGPEERCCTFRGSIVALDMTNGKILWKHYMIAEEAKPYVQGAEDAPKTGGAEVFGPAGAAVWSAPTIDAKRGVLYAATGASTTSLATTTADAIVALDLEDGKARWVKQFAPTAGADMEFGAPPILRTLPSGRQIIVTGEISGVIYGLDPDLTGEVVWLAKVGEGISASQWGAAADHRNIYVTGENRGGPQDALAGGLTALDMRTGARRWYTAAPAPVCSWGERNCWPFEPGAVTVIPGIAFVGALDGHLRAYSTIDGRILWDFDTAREYTTVNGIAASGGSLDHGGATIVNGMIYVNSGYGLKIGQPGNVLIAFSVARK